MTPCALIISRHGNMASLAPADGAPLSADLKEQLSSELSYERRRRLYGREARTFGSGMEITRVNLHRTDQHGHLQFGAGFVSRVSKLLKKSGNACSVIDVHSPNLAADRYLLDWDAVAANFVDRFRPRQDEFLVAMASNNGGLVRAPTGYGKTTMMRMGCHLYSRARIDIVVQGKDLVRQTARELSLSLPSVGMVGAGAREFGRVTVYSADSLSHSDGKSDILLVDEVHRLAAPTYAKSLARYMHSRNFGLSASPTGRFDGADMELEGLFGPIIFDMTYQEAVSLGVITQIVVTWRDVRMDKNPCNCRTDVYREKYGIWRNTRRNQIIADAAREYDDNTQVLILVRTLEHALQLRKLLPEFALCHAEQAIKADELEYYHNHGLLLPDEGVMTSKRREQLKRDFESGQIKKAIATGVWSTGVDFVKLQVLIRGDAMMSEIADTQLPGRVCRINDLGKSVGILVDFVDQFDDGFRRKALARRKHYEQHGWEQVLPGPAAKAT